MTTGAAPKDAGPRLDRDELLELQALVREVTAPSTSSSATSSSSPPSTTRPRRPPCVTPCSTARASGAARRSLASKARALLRGATNVSMEDVESVASPPPRPVPLKGRPRIRPRRHRLGVSRIPDRGPPGRRHQLIHEPRGEAAAASATRWYGFSSSAAGKVWSGTSSRRARSDPAHASSRNP